MENKKNNNKRKERNERRGDNKRKKRNSSWGDNNNCSIGTTTATLDDDTLFDILSRLPVKTLMRFKCVCKQWRSLIQFDPVFHDLHLTRSKACGDTKILFISLLSDYKKQQGRIRLLFAYGVLKRRRWNVVYRKVLDLDCTGEVRVLKPVNGLVCLCQSTSVLIYNPTTGERTSWIKSTTSDEKIEGISRRPRYFGFGFDPTTKEHKVISIWCNLESENTSSKFSDDVASQFCEVLTVGENKWRRIDAVVPLYFNRRKGDLHYINVYVNGSIYWRYRGDWCDFEPDVLIAFDVGREKFRVITIPDSVIDPQRYKFSQTVELMEVDGRIAVIRWDSEWLTTLCIFDDDDKKENSRTSSNGSKWTEESIIEIPSRWNGKPELEIEAIEGTDLIFLCQSDEPIYIYSRTTNSFEKFRIRYKDVKGLSVISTNFVESESLLPVQKPQHHSTNH